MVYKVVSLMCGGLNDGFSIGYVELQYQSGKWEHSNFIKSAIRYPEDWKQKIIGIEKKTVLEFTALHNEFATYLSANLKEFINQNNLDYKVQLIALKGFSIYDNKGFLTEAGNPGYIAAATGINVVADFTSINLSLGGNGNYLSSAATDLLPVSEQEIQLALMAVLRWREENNFTAEKTGAEKSCIGGAVWIGQEA